MLYKISPFGNTLTYMLGARMLWNLPIFSFLKKVSGIHTFFASVIVRYLILSKNLYFTNIDNKFVQPCPPLASCCLNSNLLSFQFCLRVIWKWYSCNIREIVRDINSCDTILTSSILENPRTNMLTKTSVAASVKSQNKLINHADDLTYWHSLLRFWQIRSASMTMSGFLCCKISLSSLLQQIKLA